MVDAIDDFGHLISMFIRRLGIEGALRRPARVAGAVDILELADGDFAIIGRDITQHAGELPVGSGCGPDERMVRIPGPPGAGDCSLRIRRGALNAIDALPTNSVAAPNARQPTLEICFPIGGICGSVQR